MDKVTSSGLEQRGGPVLTMETKEVTVSVEDKLFENKQRAIRILEKIDQPALYTKRVGNLPREMIHTMLAKMICQSCQRVPSPYIRYLCRNGHIFCESCAEIRFVNHGAKCMTEIQKREKEFVLEPLKKRDSSSILPIPRTLTLDYWMEDTKTEQVDLCQETLYRYPADPLFTAVWSRAQWKCPAGCDEVLEGRKLLDHVNNCCGRKSKPESNNASESSGSNYASESSGSDDDNPVSFRNAPKKNDISVNYRPMELKQPFMCNVAGCSQQVLMKDVVEHIILSHQVNAMDADADQRSWRTTGWLYIPQSEIEAGRPFYTLIRCYHRFFLFCMEPATDNSCDVGFWIRRISNMENKEEEDGPCFTYDLVMMNTLGDTQISYKKTCTSWRKPAKEVFAEKQCCKMPVSYIISQFLLNCVDENSTDGCREENIGQVSIKFSIMAANSVGELYLDDGRGAITSSMESLAIVYDNDNF